MTFLAFGVQMYAIGGTLQRLLRGEGCPGLFIGLSEGIVKLRENPPFSRRKRSALELRINNLETAIKHQERAIFVVNQTSFILHDSSLRIWHLKGNAKMLKSSLKYLWIIGGTTSLALGFLGIFLPLLPTTPFLLLSAFCYARGSSRLYDWLLRNRLFGSYIKNWREGRGIPLKSKIIAVILITVSIGYSVLYIIPYTIGKVLFVLLAVALSYYIITRPKVWRRL